jgi:hypothetical protein
MSKIVKKITKPIIKLIPKEIKPFIAPIAAYYLGPMALKGLGGAGLTGVKGFLARAAASGATSAATQKLVQDDVSKGSTLISALSGGLGAGYGGQGAQTAQGIRAAKVAGAPPGVGPGELSMLDKAKNIGLEGIAKTTEMLTPTTGKGIAKLVGAAGTASGIEKEMELVDQYNQSLTQQGIEDLGKRKNLITKYMTSAGFDESQITDALGRYGYLANGGRVGYEEDDVSYTDYGRSGVIYRDQDGNPISKEKFLEETDKEEGIPSIRMKEEPKTLKDLLENPDAVKEMLRQGMKEGGRSGIMGIGSPETVDKVGVKIKEGIGSMSDIVKDEDGNLYLPLQYLRKFGEDIFFGGQKNPELPESFYNKLSDEYIKEMEKVKERGYKDGGMINLKGREMDLRGGGFVPIGAKERADDVPARLSKNEFVFTADAVRGAGNGDVDKGAQKMYNTMKMLEGKIS